MLGFRQTAWFHVILLLKISCSICFFWNATLHHVFSFSFSPNTAGVYHKVQEDTIFKGYLLPKNTMILPNLWGLHRDPKIFPEPEKFKPDRFINSKGNFIKDRRVAAFGVGEYKAMSYKRRSVIEVPIWFDRFGQNTLWNKFVGDCLQQSYLMYKMVRRQFFILTTFSPFGIPENNFSLMFWCTVLDSLVGPICLDTESSRWAMQWVGPSFWTRSTTYLLSSVLVVLRPP